MHGRIAREVYPDRPAESLRTPERRQVRGFFERHPALKVLLFLSLGLGAAAGIGGVMLHRRLQSDPEFAMRVANANIPWLSNRVQQQLDARGARIVEQALNIGGDVIAGVGDRVNAGMHWLRSLSLSRAQPGGQPPPPGGAPPMPTPASGGGG